MKNILFILLCGISYLIYSQNKSDYTWIWGLQGVYAKFDGSTNIPSVGKYFNTWPAKGYVFTNPTNICDSATGQLLFMTNGYIAYDTIGNIMPHGDSLVPTNTYIQNAYPDQGGPQATIIIPKGSNGLYYVFTATITDSLYNIQIVNPTGDGRFPYNLLQYHVVDMHANNGLGDVVQKNIPILQHVELSKTGMQACRHANGYDWWLLKQGADSNVIYRFLVKADTIEGPWVQHFDAPHFGYYDLWGQSTFSNDGTKYAFGNGGVSVNGTKMYIADFDRCYGTLSNIKPLVPPYDSFGIPFFDTLYAGQKDTIVTGLAFSPNDSFLYITKPYNIYQYALYETDSNQVWYRVINGADTNNWHKFVEYATLQQGPDGRIYVGNLGSAVDTRHSFINNPNVKGVGCNFCRRCLEFINPNYSSVSFPNMPNFRLGALGHACWPLSNVQLAMNN